MDPTQGGVDPVFPKQTRLIPHGRISDAPRVDDDIALDELLAGYPSMSKPSGPTYDTLSAPDPTRSPVIERHSLIEGVNPGDHPASFGAAFNIARRQGKQVFTWKGRKFNTDLADDAKLVPDAGNAPGSFAEQSEGDVAPGSFAGMSKPSIVQEAAAMKARRTGATGTWDAPQAPAASDHGASSTWASNEPENGAMRTLRSIGQVYPVAETAANLATQGVALPIAGIAGIGALAGQALGADVDPAATVHNVAGALTYQPHTELGQHLTNTTMLPFEYLAKAGRYAGDATLDATGSPLAATAVDTAINALPMMVSPAAKALRREPAAPMPKHNLEMQLHALDELNTGVLAGKPLRHMSDGLLGGLVENGALSDGARAKVQTEIARREALAEALGRAAEQTPEQRGPQLLEPETKVAAAAPAVPPMADLGEIAGKPLADMSDNMLNTLVASDAISEHARERVIAELEQRQATTIRTRRPNEIPPQTDARPMAIDVEAMHGPDVPGFPLLRSAGDNGLRPLDPVPELPAGRGIPAASEGDAGTLGRDRALPSGELPLDSRPRGDATEPTRAEGRSGWRDDPDSRGGSDGGAFLRHDDSETLAARIPEPDSIAGQFDATRRPDAALPGRDADPGRVDPTAEPELFGGVRPAQAGHAPGEGAEPLIVLDHSTREVLLGRKPIDQFGQAALEKLLRGDSLSELARGKVETELARREILNSPPGAAYAGFVNDATLPAGKAVTAADLARPIRREHIVSDFAKAIDAHVYEGRIKGDKKLGFFRPKNEEVRTKHANDIEVVAHEIAHLIDFRDPKIKAAWDADPALKAELRSVSYDKAKIREGFAEAMRLYLTQPGTLKARAPKAHAWLDNLAQTHQYGPAIRKAQADMTGWYAQDALNRARSKIGSQTRLSDHLDGIMDRFRQSALDDLHGIYKMERDLTGGIAPRGAYETARLTRASTSIADGAIRNGHPHVKPDGSFEFAGKGLEAILQPVSKHLEDTLLYFVGESAQELMGQGREHLFTAGEITAMRGLHTPERAKAFAEYQKWNEGILDFAEQMGVLNPQTRKAWQRTQYLPFSRVGQPGAFKAKPGDWSGIKALTGGTENIREVLPNIIGNAVQLVDVALKNDARSRIAALAENRKGGRFMVKVPAESRPVKIDKGALIDGILKAMGLSRHDPRAAGLLSELNKLPASFIELMQGGQPPAGNNVVAVLRDGRKEWFEVGDPLLLRALESIDRPYQHWLINWLGLPKRVGQASITLSPDFWAANIARDTIMGAVMTRSGFRIGLDSLKGMRLRMTNDKVYKDYVANGGGLSSIYLDETKLRAKLERFYDKQGIDYRTVLDTPNKLIGFIESLGDAFEMSTRLGEYQRAVDNGAHPRHAAYLGREVSTDFAMRGDSKSLGVMYDTVMFLKPAVLSWDRLARGLAHDENRGGIAIKAAALAGASVALYMVNRDDPRYDDLPDWDRDANWHFFVGDKHFRYPKIWEIGALASGAERAVERTLAENPEGLAEDFARILAQTFSLNLTPQIVAPLIEQAANKNYFTGSPIETEGMGDLLPALRAKPTTSETLRRLGEATITLPEKLQINPVRAEALLHGYLNTWASYGLMLSDMAFFGDKLPTKRLDEMPVLRRFIGAEPAKHTKYEKQFYDLLGESIRMQHTMESLWEQGRLEPAKKIQAKGVSGMVKADVLDGFSETIAELRKMQDMTRRNASLTPDQKRERLDELTRTRNNLLKSAMESVKHVPN